MTIDKTEPIRRQLVEQINMKPLERELLEVNYGQVWDTQELSRDFEVIGFAAPLVVVRRKSDGVLGSMFFQHMPRFYFDFRPDKEDK